MIIPVYNAAKYVRQAVESALEQPEVCEIILVEDASPDDSLAVCQGLAREYEKVKLFQHPGGQNRGAAPSRNLGMAKSSAPFIAFLDADDFYLPGRFSIPRQIFVAEPDCDGVYEAVGIHFESKKGKQRWMASSMASQSLTCMHQEVPPEDLFRVLMKGGSGHIHLNGLVIKRAILEKSGGMNEAIADTLHEDVDFVFKLAAVGRLYPGRVQEPSSVRRVHAENRVSAPRSLESIHRDKMRLRMATYRWCKQNRQKEHQRLAFKRMLNERVLKKPHKHEWEAKLPRSTHKAWRLITWPFFFTDCLPEGFFWRELGSSVWGILRNDILNLEEKQ